MQRFIIGIVGIAVVIFGFQAFVSSKTEGGLPEIISEAAATPTEQASAPVDEPTAPVEEPAAPATTEPVAKTPAQQALDALANVPVTPATRIPAYDRDLFGKAWEDVDGNGCDTRNDILTRDMTVTAKEGTCKVLTGTLTDPYTGKTINFVRGQQTSQAVQIDHLHSLSGAWKAGAYAWSDDQRVAFANDPANLLAVDGPTNSGKSDKGPSQWMPSTVGGASYDCTYAIDYTNILVKYELTAPTTDITTLQTTLANCA